MELESILIKVNVTWEKGIQLEFLFMDSSQTIESLKQWIRNFKQIEPEDQRLIYGDYVLENHQNIKEFNNKIINLYWRIRVFNYAQLLAKVNPDFEGEQIYDESCGFITLRVNESRNKDFWEELTGYIDENYCDDLGVGSDDIEDGLFFYKSNPITEVDIIEQNIGYCLLRKQNENELHIYVFCAKEGNGRFMMNFITDIYCRDMFSEKKWKITLDSVTSAIGFYRKMGFKFENESEYDTKYFDSVWSTKENSEKFNLFRRLYIEFYDIINTDLKTKRKSKESKSFLRKHSNLLVDLYKRVLKQESTIEDFEYEMWSFLNSKIKFEIGLNKTINAEHFYRLYSNYVKHIIDTVKMILWINKTESNINQCILCESQAKFACGGCHIGYCSEKCAQYFWNNGHRECCEDD